MTEAALRCGFGAIGFSDHSYAPEQIDYCMPKEKVDEYFREVSALRDEYRGRIAVYVGIELDGDSALPEVDYDFVIASVHEMHHRGKSYPVDYSAAVQLELANELFGGSMVSYSEAYYESLVRHVKNCRPDFIGHFDLVTKYSLVPEDDKRYRDTAVSAARECMKYCDTFELNTGAIARGLRAVPYPADFILREIKSMGGRVIVTSDCHYPERLTCWFSEAEEYLSSLGFTKDPQAELNSRVRGIEIWK